jgi:hypothetical protein
VSASHPIDPFRRALQFASGDADPATELAAAAEHARARGPRLRKATGSGVARPPSRPAPTYQHDTPTRSAVLNAFLHEIGVLGLVRAEAGVIDEHLLAARLVEHARRLWMQALALKGHADQAREVKRYTAPVANDTAAAFLIKRATASHGKLGQIARDHEAEGDPARARCVMAAFAGRLAGLAVERLGAHALEDLRQDLRGLTTARSPLARRRAVRAEGRPADERAPEAPPATRRGTKA